MRIANSRGFAIYIGMRTDLSLVACLLLLLILPGTSTVSRWITPAAEADEVKSLPGWDKPLPSKQYSGYLSARDATRHLHYYYVESENDPSSDPLTLWLNGGPGASSIAYGMMTEIGQLVFNRDSLAENTTVVPALQYNRYGWSRFSNMLYLESPAGVGFSFCDDLPCTSNDTSTAEDAYDGENPIRTGGQQACGDLSLFSSSPILPAHALTHIHMHTHKGRDS